MGFLKKREFILILVGILALILFFFLMLWFYSQYRKMSAEYEKTQSLIKKSSSAAEKPIAQNIIDKVGKLIELPKETPTIATISDRTKLEKQPFFNNAQNGDKVLIFQNAKKAIIYRESENKLIEVGTIAVSPIIELSPTPFLDN